MEITSKFCNRKKKLKTMINPFDKNYAAVKMTIQKRTTKKVLMDLFLE